MFKDLLKKFVISLKPVLVELVRKALEEVLSGPAPSGASHSPKSIKAACNKVVDDYLKS